MRSNILKIWNMRIGLSTQQYRWESLKFHKVKYVRQVGPSRILEDTTVYNTKKYNYYWQRSNGWNITDPWIAVEYPRKYNCVEQPVVKDSFIHCKYCCLVGKRVKKYHNFHSCIRLIINYFHKYHCFSRDNKGLTTITVWQRTDFSRQQSQCNRSTSIVSLALGSRNSSPAIKS